VTTDAVALDTIRPDAAEHLRRLMAESLVAWQLSGSVSRADDRAVLIACGSQEIRIEPAPPHLPFRWMVIAGGRRRGAISLVAVLRQVRAALDPGYATQRVRVTAFPLVPA
jgi:hypothetical protein